jgi:limonene-1,2-epoxide hydrolase
MNNTNAKQTKGTSAREIVLSFIDAMNNLDYPSARTFVHDDMTFRGVLGSRDGADAYFKDMEKMKFKYNVLQSFEEGNDVCLIYDVKMGDATILTCGWYKVEREKISGFKVIFDPRQVLEMAK